MPSDIVGAVLRYEARKQRFGGQLWQLRGILVGLVAFSGAAIGGGVAC